MKQTYVTSGVCSRKVEFELNENTVKNINFEGGCSGNSKGIAALAEGLYKDDVIKKLKGIKCGTRTTSCPDQLALALEQSK
ncbi:MAG: TIGR03905 family TSCPD domain-containing protein [Firmicutes bacterium]|nr:TIGR03905 family TSCPD domain-containing protein [Bacillota bacterium]